MRLRTIVLLPALLAACSSPLVRDDQFSGFLPSYDQLEVVETPSGAQLRRWIDPDADLSSYDSVYVHPVVFHPPQQSTEQVSTATLDAIRSRFDQIFVEELGKARQIASAPGAGTLEIAPAISAVTVTAEGLHAYEVIPVALVVAGISEATGARDRDTRVYVEVLASDGTTGEPVVLAVRRLEGESLENSSTQLEADAFEDAFRAAATDARTLFGSGASNP